MTVYAAYLGECLFAPPSALSLSIAALRNAIEDHRPVLLSTQLAMSLLCRQTLLGGPFARGYERNQRNFQRHAAAGR